MMVMGSDPFNQIKTYKLILAGRQAINEGINKWVNKWERKESSSLQ